MMIIIIIIIIDNIRDGLCKSMIIGAEVFGKLIAKIYSLTQLN